MFATVRLNTASRTGVVTVPRSAVLSYYGDSVVYVVDSGGVARRRVIEPGLQGDTVEEVVSGLEEGDLLVVEGQNFLQDGDQVRIIE
jgi:multidrug efflux pump subunit AcrA (membrane-fusion protein)